MARPLFNSLFRRYYRSPRTFKGQLTVAGPAPSLTRREPAREPPSAEQLLPRRRRGEVRNLLTQEAPGTGGQRPPGPAGAEQGSGPHAAGVQQELRPGRRGFLCVGLSPRVFPEAASDRSPCSSSPTPARGLLGPRRRPLRNPVPTPSLELPAGRLGWQSGRWGCGSGEPPVLPAAAEHTGGSGRAL